MSAMPLSEIVHELNEMKDDDLMFVLDEITRCFHYRGCLRPLGDGEDCHCDNDD
jgi:hypothetical protein